MAMTVRRSAELRLLTLPRPEVSLTKPPGVPGARSETVRLFLSEDGTAAVPLEEADLRGLRFLPAFLPEDHYFQITRSPRVS